MHIAAGKGHADAVRLCVELGARSFETAKIYATNAGRPDMVALLDELAASPPLAGNADLKAAAASYARFTETKTEIVKLSRENTNVRSLSISLNQKHKAMLVCQGVLAALQDAIEAEPIAGVTYGKVMPR